MLHIQHYWFGYVVEKTNARYEILQETNRPYISYNIFGQEIVCNKYERIAWSRFTPSVALSQAYKTLDEAETFRRIYGHAN